MTVTDRHILPGPQTDDPLIVELETYRKYGRAPVPTAGGIPKGVTVREIGSDKPAVAKPRNLIEQAALCDDRDFAASLLLSVLGITNTGVCVANLSDPAMWKRTPVEARLNEIGHWLRGECFELMDLVAFDTPKNMTIGD